jgi:hypothetical protein
MASSPREAGPQRWPCAPGGVAGGEAEESGVEHADDRADDGQRGGGSELVGVVDGQAVVGLDEEQVVPRNPLAPP